MDLANISDLRNLHIAVNQIQKQHGSDKLPSSRAFWSFPLVFFVITEVIKGVFVF